MATGRVSKVKGKVLDIPNPPTVGTATDSGNGGVVLITFTANSSGVGGPALSYIAKSSPSSITGTATTSPVTVSGLTNGTSYTFTVAGVNPTGTGEYSSASNSVSPTQAVRAIFVGGNNPADNTGFNAMSYLTWASGGTTTSFGTLITGRSGLGTCASETRGVIVAGATGASGFGNISSIEYITFTTSGNGTAFGNLNQAMAATTACSSLTRGVQGTGEPSQGSNSNTLNYITIASTGNSTSFGTLTARRFATASGSTTRGIFANGYTSASSNLIEYITIASTGNGTTFGNLTYSNYGSTSASNNTRSLIGNSGAYDYITIASTGNGTSFGNLTSAKGGGAGTATDTYAIFAGGYDTAYRTTIDRFTIATTGNASSFGNLITATASNGALSAKF
jgi:hypothetical protein